MSGFLGSYLHQIDSKGRLNLPAPFRRDTPDRPFVLVQVHANALTLYPEPAWAEVEQRLREALHREPKLRPPVLRLLANALEVVPDRQGRILIPRRMQDTANLDDSALLVGVLDRIEVWNPDDFQSEVSEHSVEFDNLTHRIFS